MLDCTVKSIVFDPQPQVFYQITSDVINFHAVPIIIYFRLNT